MSTFKRCPDEVNELAREILCEFETHKPLLDARVTVDFVFAFADIDEQTQEPIGNALSKNGIKALGLCRKLPTKDRAMGRADAEFPSMASGGKLRRKASGGHCWTMSFITSRSRSINAVWSKMTRAAR